MKIELIGVSPNIKKIKELIEQVADTGLNTVVYGEVLLSSGYVGHDALMEAIRFQIHEVAMDILFWKKGEFQYRDCILKFDQAGVEEISTITILFEATLKHDELDAA